MPRLKQIGIDVEVNGVIEKNRRTFSESGNDILRRLLLPKPPSESPRPGSVVRAPAELRGPVRARGLWTVEFRGKRLSAPNLKGAYRLLLLTLNDAFPAFLDRFSKEKGRSRLYVARAPDQLYLSTPGLARDFAEPLVDGWFFDTNLSAQQVAKRARVAARVAGLAYGREVRILNNLQEI